jgi:hypothetical protein
LSDEPPAGPGEAGSGRKVGWAGVVLVSACAALAALVEALMVPLYAGSVIVPVAVVLALIGNVAFPRMARTLVPTTLASVVPLLVWLAVMFLFLSGRPEGDLAFPGKPDAVVWVFYGTLFGGVVVGIGAVVTAMPPPVSRSAATDPVSPRPARR